MKLIKTPTPAYSKQSQLRPRERLPTITGWLANLLRTPTPAYQSKPERPAEAPEPPTGPPES